MKLLATAVVLLPLANAAFCALSATRPRLQQTISFAGIITFLAVALTLVFNIPPTSAVSVVFGSWPVPYGIEFQLDGLSSILILVSALMGFASLLFLLSDADPGKRHPLLLPLIHGTLAGCAGAFATADLFNLYVWFEIILICALGLIVIGGRPAQMDAAFKYLGLNLFGTLLLLASVGMLYAASGQLNYDALAHAARNLDPPLLHALLATLGVALLLKAGAFPLFAWLPASYPTLPAPVLALVAGLLTKVGVYALMRTFGDIFFPASSVLLPALGWIAAATMLVGVLGAAYHWDMRRILAFHIISQIGYILLAIALGGEKGNAAALFYTVHHIIVKANLFLIAGMIAATTGSYDLRRIGGLAAGKPALAILFAVPALSLVGIPPLSGFWAKVLVLNESFAQQRYVWGAIALLVSVLTLYSMMKIWLEAFWKEHPKPTCSPHKPYLVPAWIATVMLAVVTLSIGLWPETLIDFAQQVAGRLGTR